METSASIAAKIDDKFKVAVVDYSAPDAAKKFTDSLKSTGFAVLTNHPVSNDLIQGVYSEWRDFMIALHKHAATAQLPPDGSASDNLAEKYYRSLETQDGYFPMAVSETAKGASVKDLKHYFQCYFPHGRFPREEVSGGAQQLWSELIALGRTLVAWIDDHMPPEIKATIQQKIGEGRTLMDCVSDARTMMRILHYPGYDDANEARRGDASPPQNPSSAAPAAASQRERAAPARPGTRRGARRGARGHQSDHGAARRLGARPAGAPAAGSGRVRARSVWALRVCAWWWGGVAPPLRTDEPALGVAAAAGQVAAVGRVVRGAARRGLHRHQHRRHDAGAPASARRRKSRPTPALRHRSLARAPLRRRRRRRAHALRPFATRGRR